MKPGELIDYLIDLYRGFDSTVGSFEFYFENYIENRPLMEEKDLEFVRKVVEGCSRYEQLLDIVVQKYLQSTRVALRTDSELYMLITYLSLLALDDIGFDNFKLFVTSQKSLKVL
jgi:hypothetical protein